MSKPFKADIVVDVRSPKGRKTLFIPTQTSLTGDIYPTDLVSGAGSPAFVQQIGFIPGDQIQIDTQQKIGKVVAKIGFPEHETKLELLKRIAKSERYMHARFSVVAKDQVFKLSEMELRSWLFHISRLVDRNRMVVVSGKVPNAEELLLEGPVVLSDSAGVNPKDRDRPFYYADERDIGHLDELGGFRSEPKKPASTKA